MGHPMTLSYTWLLKPTHLVPVFASQILDSSNPGTLSTFDFWRIALSTQWYRVEIVQS